MEVHADDCLAAIEDTIYAAESFDTTTIRASVPQYLLSRYVRDNTEDVVIYSGEGADEVCQGYIYFKNAPSKAESALESMWLMQHLHEYDLLRADRVSAAHSLELREPFMDKEFMQHIWNLPANVKCPR